MLLSLTEEGGKKRRLKYTNRQTAFLFAPAPRRLGPVNFTYLLICIAVVIYLASYCFITQTHHAS